MKVYFVLWTFSIVSFSSCEGAARKYDVPQHAAWTETGSDGREKSPPVKYVVDGKDWCAVLTLKTRIFVAAEVRGQLYCTDAKVDLRGFSPFERLQPAFDAVNRDLKRTKSYKSLSSDSVPSNGKNASLKGEFDPTLGFPIHLVFQVDGETEISSFFYTDFKRLTHTKAANAITERIKGIPAR